MINPFFSVIIPTFNRSSFIERAIDSVLKQNFKDYELIIVDDGSTDNTIDLIKKYESKLTIVSQNNKGVSSARNLGVTKSSGEWICFLDSDDEWFEDKLQRQFDFIKENKSLPAVHGQEIWIRNGVRVNQKKIHEKHGGRIFQKCLKICFISPSTVSIRKDIFEELSGFDESFPVCEDYDLWLKLSSLYEIGFIKNPLIKKYGGHEDQLSKKFYAMDLWRLKSMTNILKIRKLNLENERECLEQIKIKSSLLIKGYNKYNNSDAIKEVKLLISGLDI